MVVRVLPLEVLVVGFHAHRRALAPRRELERGRAAALEPRCARAQPLSKRVRYRVRNLVLYGEDVCQLPVEAAAPELIAIGGVHQLRRDADPIFGAAHASLEHRRHMELLSERAQVDLLPLESEARAPRGDAELSVLGEDAQDFFAHAVGEVFDLWIGAEVDERKDGDRRSCRRYRRRKRGRQVSHQVRYLARATGTFLWRLG